MGAGKPKGKSKTPHAKSAYGAPGGAAEACPNVAAKRKAGPSASLGMTIFCAAVMVGRFCLVELSGLRCCQGPSTTRPALGETERRKMLAALVGMTEACCVTTLVRDGRLRRVVYHV